MDTNIGADAAKLASLQIALLQKLNDGQLTLEQIEGFLNLRKEDRDLCLSGKQVIVSEKFGLLADLGIINVSKGYNHATQLAEFKQANRSKFYGYNDKITDANFPNPTRILKPGDKLTVRAFKQVVDGTTTSEERMAFLAAQKAVHTGAQGASLVWKQKRDQLPKGYWYTSFDEKERLWKDANGRRRVSSVNAHSDGAFFFRLGYFEDVWYDYNAFLCLCDLE